MYYINIEYSLYTTSKTNIKYKLGYLINLYTYLFYFSFVIIYTHTLNLYINIYNLLA